MSLKIWTAYRLKKGVKLWDFVRDARMKAEKRATAVLRSESARILKYWTEESSEYIDAALKEIGVTDKSNLKPYDVTRYIGLHFQKDVDKDVFDIGVDIVFREHRGRTYLIPHASNIMEHVLDFLKRDKRLEEFHYQNSSDKDSKCSTTEWNRRKKIWEELLDGHGNKSREYDALVLEVVSRGNFWRIDPIYADSVIRSLSHDK